MATSGEKTALGELSQEATCPLCLDFFKQPMGLSCGHNFCDCLAQLGGAQRLPQPALANVVCLVKRLRLSEGAQEESSGQPLCQEHRQPLQSFCSSEKSLLCPGCLEGHQGHPILALSEAAQQYKVGTNSLGHSISSLGGQAQGSPKAHKGYQVKKWQRRTRLFFGSERGEGGGDQLSVARLLMGPCLPLRAPSRASRLQQLIAQTERKCRQPDGEFLQVGEPSLASRGAEGLWGGRRSPLQGQHPLLSSPLSGHPGHRRQVGAILPFPTPVSVGGLFQECPDVPGRFDREFCVLGSEGFTTGWHWWEVSVQGDYNSTVRGKACWAIGVAKESIRRKGSFQLSPQEGIWAVGRAVGGKTVAFSKVPQILYSSWPRLRVRLDCEAKEVEFLDAETEASLHTFRMWPFPGETLWPFFYLGQVGVTLSM
uniref:Uncharacterized protein n=1 Tax=Naja naja TaxID=35670 RepID=A0A8C6VKX1_NAJNA